MNKIYRLIWSKVKERMVIVSEIVKSKGGPSPVTVVAAGVITILLFLTPTGARALPNGGQVVAGQATFDRQGNILNVTNSPNAVINWQSFSINTNETTRFIQQNSSSAVLNRVIGMDPSSILGSLLSNGKVFLINPNGIFFGPGARIDVSGLIASTLNLSNQDFFAGKYNFTAGINAGVIKNEGAITTPAGGKVYLIAPDVENSGIITSPKGDVLLAAGKSVQLVDSTSPDIAVVISAPENRALNLGKIVADSGRVGIYAGLINNKGTVSANSAVVGENGKIIFKATKDITLDKGSIVSADGPQGGQITVQSKEGTTRVSGSVSAKGAEGTGGLIKILGDRVGLFGAAVDASGQAGGGAILIGGDYQGKNPEVQNSKISYISPDTAIKADAVENGNGGKVTVWADDTTKFYGSISAKGGAQSGDGGFVEVSGKEDLIFRGAVDTRAPQGKTGSLLLDPTDITIGATAYSGTSPQLGGNSDSIWALGEDAGSQTITPSEISSILTTTDVTLQASNNITWSSGSTLDYDGIGTSGKTLALKANNNIVHSGTITDSNTGTADNLNVVFNADADANGAGNIQLNSGSKIETNGGDIVLGGGANPLITAAVGSGTTDTVNYSDRVGIYLNNAILNAGDGSISMKGTGIAGTGSAYGIAVTGGSVVQTGTGAITIDGTGGAGTSKNYGVRITGAGTTVSTTSGVISITGVGKGSGASNDGIRINGGASITSTGAAATITLDGTGSNTGTNYNYGVLVSDLNTAVSSVDGDISITGVGKGTGYQNYGVYIRNTAHVTSTGAANITMLGDSLGVGFSNNGVRIDGGAVVSAVGTGAISLTGNGSSAGTDFNYGILISDTSTVVSSVGGNISITGTGDGSGSSNYGVYIRNNAVVSSTGTGNITIDGTAGFGENGVYLSNNVQIATTGGAASIYAIGSIYMDETSLIDTSGNGTYADGRNITLQTTGNNAGITVEGTLNAKGYPSTTEGSPAGTDGILNISTTGATSAVNITGTVLSKLASGGVAGDVVLNSASSIRTKGSNISITPAGKIEIDGTISAKPDINFSGAGQPGGSITLSTTGNSNPIFISDAGVVDASGAEGVSEGGDGGTIAISAGAGTGIDSYISILGSVTSNGGWATGGKGGKGGAITVSTAGADAYISIPGNISAKGGTNRTASWTAASLPAQGGSVTVSTVGAGAYIDLTGTGSIDVSGGNAQGGWGELGGPGGSVTISTSGDVSGFTDNPAYIKIAGAITTNGGLNWHDWNCAGTCPAIVPGQGGAVDISTTGLDAYILIPGTISADGGASHNVYAEGSTGGRGGTINVRTSDDSAYINIAGTITAKGGMASHSSGAAQNTGGSGGTVTIQTAGASSSISVSGTVSANGGNATVSSGAATGGNGGTVDIKTTGATSSSINISGVLNNRGGSASVSSGTSTVGTDGVLTVSTTGTSSSVTITGTILSKTITDGVNGDVILNSGSTISAKGSDISITPAKKIEIFGTVDTSGNSANPDGGAITIQTTADNALINIEGTLNSKGYLPGSGADGAVTVSTSGLPSVITVTGTILSKSSSAGTTGDVVLNSGSSMTTKGSNIFVTPTGMVEIDGTISTKPDPVFVGPGANGGDITLTTVNNPISIAGTIDASGDGGESSGGIGGTIAINTTGDNAYIDISGTLASNGGYANATWGSVTAGSGGNIAIGTTGAAAYIKVYGDVSAKGGNATAAYSFDAIGGSGGAVSITTTGNGAYIDISKTGATKNIYTYGGNAKVNLSDSGNMAAIGGAGGSVTITTTGSDSRIDVNSHINTYGGSAEVIGTNNTEGFGAQATGGNGGAVTIQTSGTTSPISITANINTYGGAANINVTNNGSSNGSITATGGNGGAVTISTAQTSSAITISGDINNYGGTGTAALVGNANSNSSVSAYGGDGGSVNISTSQTSSPITITGNINTYGGAATATVTQNENSYAEASAFGGDGGTVTISTAQTSSAITITGNINAYGGLATATATQNGNSNASAYADGGWGGDVAITTSLATSSVTITGDINAYGGTGEATVNGANLNNTASASSDGGDGGSVSITTQGATSAISIVGGINTYGGNAAVSAVADGVPLNTSGGDGGNITLQASGASSNITGDGNINAKGGAGLTAADVGADGSVAISTNTTDGAINISVTGEVNSSKYSFAAAQLTLTAGQGINLSNSIPTVSLTNTTSGDIIYTSTLPSNSTLNIAAVNDAVNGNVILSSDASVTQSGPITAFGLQLNGAGIYTLTHNGNSVSILAGNIGGLDFKNHYDNKAAFEIGTVGNVSGMITSGDLVINNWGAFDTGTSAVASGGALTLIAHSPLTIGTGGVSAAGNVTLEAAANGSGDNLVINGNVASSSGSVSLKAGNDISGSGAISAPNGTVTKISNLNPSTTTDTNNILQQSNVQQAVDNTVKALDTVSDTQTPPPPPPTQTSEQPASSPEGNGAADNGKKDENKEDEKKEDKKKTAEEKKTDGDKKDDMAKKQYCN